MRELLPAHLPVVCRPLTANRRAPNSERARAAAHGAPVRRRRRLPVPELVRVRPPAEPRAVRRGRERARRRRLRVSYARSPLGTAFRLC